MNRRLALAALVSASALLLASCASGDATGEPTAHGGDGVTLVHPTIDGLEIDFDAQPENIVMDCYAYSSLHEYGIEPVALFGYECDNPFVMGDADISGIEVCRRIKSDVSTCTVLVLQTSAALIGRDDKIRGLDVIVATTAKTDEEARELLRLFGFPFPIEDADTEKKAA